MHDVPSSDASPADDDPTRISRRALIGGLGAAGAAGLITLGGAEHVTAAGSPTEAIAPAIPGLVYLPLDAFAFDVAEPTDTVYRLYQETTGMQPQPASRPIYASLPIPAGAVIKQINVSYQGTPIVKIIRRGLTGTLITDHTPLTSLAAGGGQKSQTLSVDATITSGATYAVYAYCSSGDSILGVEIGYVPPAQAFVPYTGTTPRALDTREAGSTRFAANEERTLDLSSRLIATGRAAVINVTAVSTAGPGFVAVFSDGIAYPGNSTVNFTAANQTIANSAVCTMAGGKIKIRCGPAATHVLVDVIGTLL